MAKENTIIMEQFADGAIAINEESMLNILTLAASVTSDVAINDLNSKETKIFVKQVIELFGVTILTAMFHPKVFSSMLEKLDIADVKVTTDKKENNKTNGKEFWS